MTPDRGDRLGVHLAELWLCGKSFLPGAAYTYVGVSVQASGLMPPTGPTNRVYPVWDKLREQLQTILADSGDCLYESGEALVRVADLYAATDADASTTMKAQQELYTSNEAFHIEERAYHPTFPRPE